MTIKRLAIYCGALQGKDPDYMVEAEKVGEWLAAHQIELVYGGGVQLPRLLRQPQKATGDDESGRLLGRPILT